MQCYNKVVFSKLIFSVKVLIYVSRGNDACFLHLLIILKCTLGYFYHGSKHHVTRSDCIPGRVHTFLFYVAYYAIGGILRL